MSSDLCNGEGRVKLNGIAHWYKIAGAEQSTTPIVVIHGGPGGNVYSFERTIGPKLEEFATLIYYEQRGCGRSDPPPDSHAYSLPILVSDLEMLRQTLEVERIIPLGFSFGGQLALEYTLAYPQHVEKLTVQAPWEKGERIAAVQLYGFTVVARGEMAGRIQEIVNAQVSLEERLEKVWKIVDDATADRFLFYNGDMARINRRLWEESGLTNTGQMHKALAEQPSGVPLLDRIDTIQAPTLVMIGLYDRNVGVEFCRDVAATIPQARLVLFEHSAHFPDIEETEKYAQTVRSFLLAECA